MSKAGSSRTDSRPWVRTPLGGVYAPGCVRACLSLRRAARAPLSLAASAALLSVFVLLTLFTSAGRATVDGLGPNEIESEWRITPLGPEGADIAQIFLLSDGRRLAISTAGTFHVWVALESPFRTGMWRPVGRTRFFPGEVLLAQGIPGSTSGPFVLLRSGRLLRWLEPEEWLEQPLPGEDEQALYDEGCLHGAFRAIGALTPQVARQVVALLPGEADDPQAVLALTRYGDVTAIGPDRSTDSWQLTWQDRREDSAGGEERLRQVTQALILGQHPRQVFVLTKWEGLFVSHDHGHSVTPVAGELPMEVSAISVCETGGLCAVTPDGLLTSRDGGAQWQRLGPVTTLEWAAYGELRSVHRAPMGGQTAFAITREGRLLRTINGGHAWQPQLSDLPVRVRSLVCDDASGEILLATSRGILAATAPFERWRWRNHGLRQVTVLSTCQLPDERILVGTQLGLYVFDCLTRQWCPTDQEPHFADGLGGEPTPDDQGDDATWRRLSGSVACLDVSPSDDGGWCLGVGSDEGAATCHLPDARVDLSWRAAGPRRAVTSVEARGDGSLWATGIEGPGVWLGQASGPDTWTSRDELLEPRCTAERPACPPRFLNADGAAAGPTLLSHGEVWSLGRGEPWAWDLPAAGRPLAGWHTEIATYLATDLGLFARVADGPWSEAGFRGERILDLQAALHAPETMLCRTSDGIYWSTRTGWSASGEPTGPVGRSWEEVPVPPELAATSASLSLDGSGVLLGTKFGLFLAEPPESELLIKEPRPIFATPNPFSQHVQLRCCIDTARFLDLNQTTAGTSTREVEVDSSVGGEPSRTATSRAEQRQVTEIGATGASPGSEAAAQASDPGEAAPESVSSAPAEIRVFSVHGQLVRRLVGAEALTDEAGAPYLQWHWDGRTERGQEAPNGIYLLSTRLGPQSYVGKLVKFR